MPEMTKYEHGVPSWIDIGLPDLESGLRFYSELFGWESQDMGEESGHYTIVSKNGKRSPRSEQRAGCRTAEVDDLCERRQRRRRDREGEGCRWRRSDATDGSHVRPGRMAIFADTTGAVIAIWQPADHIGAQLVNEPGSYVWGELSTSDIGRSKEFYSAVFDWGWGGAEEYAEAQVNGRTVVGVMPRA